VILSRRHVLGIGGVILAAPLSGRAALAGASAEIEIRIQGNSDGSQVWFDPTGIRIQPGQTIRWINLDPGNSHTTTAYHPQNFERPLRIPERAAPWNSDYLLPNESFAITFMVEGIYDYFCIPHEHAGMVGRIIVGRPSGPHSDSTASRATGEGADPIPEVALRAFPSVDEIMQRGIVRRT
jgi:plastocyanin